MTGRNSNSVTSQPLLSKCNQILSLSSNQRACTNLVDLGQFAQSRLEDLAGLAHKRRPTHDRRRIGERAGDADADRTRPAEQRTGVGTRGMALNQNLALEGIALRRI